MKLQRGPKSYSYIPFVKAMEIFYNHDNLRQENMTNSESKKRDISMITGISNFFDDCEEEFDEGGYNVDGDDEPDDEEDFDDFYNSQSLVTGPVTVLQPSTTSVNKDIHALEAMITALNKLKSGYHINHCNSINNFNSGNGCNEAATSPLLTPEDKYCAIFVRSELQTLDFYIAAAKFLKSKLVALRETPSEGNIYQTSTIEKQTLMDEFSFDNHLATWKQIEDLSKAFLSVKYPGINVDKS